MELSIGTQEASFSSSSLSSFSIWWVRRALEGEEGTRGGGDVERGPRQCQEGKEYAWAVSAPSWDLYTVSLYLLTD